MNCLIHFLQSWATETLHMSLIVAHHNLHLCSWWLSWSNPQKCMTKDPWSKHKTNPPSRLKHSEQPHATLMSCKIALYTCPDWTFYPIHSCRHVMLVSTHTIKNSTSTFSLHGGWHWLPFPTTSVSKILSRNSSI